MQESRLHIRLLDMTSSATQQNTEAATQQNTESAAEN